MGTALPIFFLCLSISCWLQTRTRLVTCNRYQRWYWWWGRGSRQGWKDCVKSDPQIPLRICRSETAKETAGRPPSCQNNQCFPQRSEQNCSFVGVFLLSHSFSFSIFPFFGVSVYRIYLSSSRVCRRFAMNPISAPEICFLQQMSCTLCWRWSLVCPVAAS